MKTYYTSNIKTSTFLLLAIVFIGFYSCGTYQSAYNEDDGIYATTTNKKKRL